MKDEAKNKAQLIKELTEMRQRTALLEDEQTAQKVVEESLRESTDRFRKIIDNIPVKLFVKDVNSTYLECNRGYAQDLGIRPADIAGKTDYDFYPQELAEKYRSDDNKVMESAQKMEVEEAYIKDRQPYFVKTIKTPLIDEAGKVTGILGVFWDITDRKLAQEELDRYRGGLEDLVKERTARLAKLNERLTREIEERKKAEQALQEWQQMLQSVLDTIPVRVFWKDLDSNYLGCNRPFALDAGLQSPEEITGKNDFEMGWAEQAELYRADDRSVMETGRPKLGYEEPQTTPAGDRIWLRTNKVPLLDAEGRIKGVLGTYEDITARKAMEERLRTSETKYRIVADNTYDWEYWVSAEGRFLYTSPSCKRITGYAASEFETDPQAAFPALFTPMI